MKWLITKAEKFCEKFQPYFPLLLMLNLIYGGAMIGWKTLQGVWFVVKYVFKL